MEVQDCAEVSKVWYWIKKISLMDEINLTVRI